MRGDTPSSAHREVHRGAVAEIDLEAVARNFRAVKRLADRPVIAVVKADAYGHGAAEVSRRLSAAGAEYLAVAFTSEAIKLREAGIQTPILVLFDKNDPADFFEYDLIPVIHDLGTARRMSREAGKRNLTLDVHVKIDTGMGRLGFNSRNILKEIVAVAGMDHLRVAGLMSHFSDSDIADTSYAERQLKSFHAVRDTLRKKTKVPFLCHMANSAATLSLKSAHLDAVRPGLILYGHSPFQQSAVGRSAVPRTPNVKLIPAMKVRTEILSLRKLRTGTPVSYGRTFITRRNSVIGVVPVGYGDGYSRALTNAMDVLVRGKRAPVVGRVCMDLVMVDVTEIGEVKEKDEVVLIGKQGNEEITAAEMAAKSGTISYETLISLGSRARRIYV